METEDTSRLLYFEYYENEKTGFDAEGFMEKYNLTWKNENKGNVFSFLEQCLEPGEKRRLCKWKETFKEKKMDISTFYFNIKTKKGIRKLTMTMIPIMDERNQKIEYYVGYFS